MYQPLPGPCPNWPRPLFDDTTTERCGSCGHPFADDCDDMCCTPEGEIPQGAVEPISHEDALAFFDWR